MSVTIISMAGLHTPAFNNQYLVASSTNVAQTNFKYVVTVQINDGLYDTNVQLPVAPRPDNKYLYYDPQEIVRNYVKSEFKHTETNFFFPAPNVRSSLKKVTIGVSEEYGSPVSGFAGASGSYYVWNAAYNNIDFASFVYSTTTKSKDLTLSPSLTDNINYNQKYLMKTWHRGFSTRDNRYLSILALDVFGNTIQDSVIENSFYSIGGFYSNNHIGLNISPYGLNNFSGTVISKSVPASPIIPTNTAQYTLYFYSVAPAISNISSNLYTVNCVNTGCKYDRYVLHFLNSLGNYDSFTFAKLSRNNTDKETDQYKQIPYYLDSANKYRYEKYTNDTVIYSTVLKNKLTLNSDNLTEAQGEWLRDLMASPDIKMETSTGDIISVICTLKSYEPKKKVNDKIFNMTIEVENALQDKRQC